MHRLDRCDGLGERMAIAEGTFNLLVDGRRPAPARDALPPASPHDRAGRPVTLAGFKNVQDGWFHDTWVDTSTLFTRLYAGWSARDDEDARHARWPPGSCTSPPAASWP